MGVGVGGEDGRSGCTDYTEPMAHSTAPLPVVLFKARRWLIFSEGREQVLLIGADSSGRWLQGKQATGTEWGEVGRGAIYEKL